MPSQTPYGWTGALPSAGFKKGGKLFSGEHCGPNMPDDMGSTIKPCCNFTAGRKGNCFNKQVTSGFSASEAAPASQGDGPATGDFGGFGIL